MANCNYNMGYECDRLATTTLTKNNGEVVQFCEEHRQFMIDFFKGVAAGEIDMEHDDQIPVATHWLVKNKISS